MTNHEITQQRRDEAFKDACNRIADFVATELISVDVIGPAEIRRLGVDAVAKFSGRLPDGMIVRLVAASMEQEAGRRFVIASLPAPSRRLRHRRILRNENVISSV